MSNPKAVMQAYMEAVSRRDFDTVAQLFHPHYSYTTADGVRRDGIDAGLEMVRIYTSAFPDLRFDVTRMIAAGDMVVSEFVIRATHRGELFGLQPTGRSVVIPICNVIEVRDGKIFAEREYFDAAHLLRQLSASGASAAPAPA